MILTSVGLPLSTSELEEEQYCYWVFRCDSALASLLDQFFHTKLGGQDYGTQYNIKSLAVLTRLPKMFSWQRMMQGFESWKQDWQEGRSVGGKSIYKLAPAKGSLKINIRSLVELDSGISWKECWRVKSNCNLISLWKWLPSAVTDRWTRHSHLEMPLDLGSSLMDLFSRLLASVQSSVVALPFWALKKIFRFFFCDSVPLLVTSLEIWPRSETVKWIWLGWPVPLLSFWPIGNLLDCYARYLIPFKHWFIECQVYGTL